MAENTHDRIVELQNRLTAYQNLTPNAQYDARDIRIVIRQLNDEIRELQATDKN